MPLLDMTALQLKGKGFNQKVFKNRVIYKKPTLNGYFMFNPLEKVYRWYHVTNIGDTKNSVVLDICSELELDIILKVFK